MPRKTSGDQIAVERTTVDKQVAKSPAISVGSATVDDNIATKHGVAHELLGVVAEGLPAFWGVDAFKSDADGLPVSVENVDRVAVDKRDDTPS